MNANEGLNENKETAPVGAAITPPVETKTTTPQTTTSTDPPKVDPVTITLKLFQVTEGINDMEYAGFKSMLGANDSDNFNKTDLMNKLIEYRGKEVFKNIKEV